MLSAPAEPEPNPASLSPDQVSMADGKSDRLGECRICFEKGGDLIAPCLCAGSSKWIHRGCLDHWRASGSNPRALTNCPSCTFQYHLKLHRIMSGDTEERRRQFWRRLAGQSLMAFAGLQVIICGLALLIRWIDYKEHLVQLFDFHQDHGYKDLHRGSFLQALQHHKETYYLAGILAFLACLGFSVVAMGLAELCMQCCGTPRRTRSPALIYHPTLYDAYCCHDCCQCTADCGTLCIRGECRCPNDPCPGGCPNVGGGSAGGGETLLVLALVVVVAAIVIGLIALIVAVVMTGQGVLKRYAALQEMRVLSQEYIVVDLAKPSDDGKDGIFSRLPDTEERSAQQEIERDLSRIFGDGSDDAPSPQAWRGYGSV